MIAGPLGSQQNKRFLMGAGVNDVLVYVVHGPARQKPESLLFQYGPAQLPPIAGQYLFPETKQAVECPPMTQILPPEDGAPRP